jgi:hypothetical protein
VGSARARGRLGFGGGVVETGGAPDELDEVARVALYAAQVRQLLDIKVFGHEEGTWHGEGGLHAHCVRPAAIPTDLPIAGATAAAAAAGKTIVKYGIEMSRLGKLSSAVARSTLGALPRLMRCPKSQHASRAV